MALPDFFVAGAPKAGTTALHAALARHPSLYMSAVKEPKFFLTDGPPPTRGGPGDAQTYRDHVWRRENYEALFDPAPAGALRGESTPFYLYRRSAQQRIRALIPAAKLIVCLRDPVERAHSNWAHLWSAGLDPIGDFVQACAEEDRRIAAGWADFWHYTALGRYGEQLEQLYSVFPTSQVFVLRYRALLENPVQALDRICGFLGVEQGVITEVPRENVTSHPRLSPRYQVVSRALRMVSAASRVPGAKAARRSLERTLQRDGSPRRPLTWEQRQELIPIFEADIRLLEVITGGDYSDWLQPRGDTGGLVGVRPAGQDQARNGLPRGFLRSELGGRSESQRSSVRSSCAPSARVIS
jgi:Sulfotransferase family